MTAPFPAFPPPQPRQTLDSTGSVHVELLSRAEAKQAKTELLHQQLERVRSPNGDIYRREHLQAIGEDGLRALYMEDAITQPELEQFLAEMISEEPDPLD